MAGYQFIHVNAYARSSSDGKKGNIHTIAREADRVEGNFEHVENAGIPTLLQGIPACDAAVLAEERAGKAVQTSGKKFRKDGLCMLAGVCSYPATTEEISNNKEEAEKFEKWKEDTLLFLNNKYKEALQSVILHMDESHPHIHFFAVPELRENNVLTIEDIHQGYAAKRDAKRNGVLDGKANFEFKRAMREFQDEYFASVGMKNGQTRRGPGKRRLSREAWKAEQANVELLSKVSQEIEEKRIQSEKATSEEISQRLAKADEEISSKFKELDREKQGIEVDKSRIDYEKSKISEIVSSLKAKEKALADKEKVLEIKLKGFEKEKAKYNEDLFNERRKVKKREERAKLKEKELDLRLSNFEEEKKKYAGIGGKFSNIILGITGEKERMLKDVEAELEAKYLKEIDKLEKKIEKAESRAEAAESRVSDLHKKIFEKERDNKDLQKDLIEMRRDLDVALKRSKVSKADLERSGPRI